MRRATLILVAILLLAVWYRGHTLGPSIEQATGLRLWPAATGETEPLDCDEAAYAYIGHRLLRGDVLYRDLTENKPPLGYWLYALGVKVGGYRELSIRLLPIPAVLLAIVLLWRIGCAEGGVLAGGMAAFLYTVLSTDPYLFGNGSNLEHFMNLFSVGSLALFLGGGRLPTVGRLAAAGACVAAAAAVKQVAALPLAVYSFALLLPRGPGLEERGAAGWKRRLAEQTALVGGFAAVVVLVAVILVVQGAGSSAYEDIFVYGRALATDTLPQPGAPSGLVRWLTGNADPSGRLPPPFGSTDYLVWWGKGSWPLWLAAVGVLAAHGLRSRKSPGSGLVAAWTLAAAVQVVLPGLYWPHYYLLPTPGIALLVAIGLTQSLKALRTPLPSASGLSRRRARRQWFLAALAASGLIAAAAATVLLQVRDYLLVPPSELTVRYKGGRQWVALRALGRELAARAQRFPPESRLYVWGWQSPLHFYSGLDSPTRHFFVDNLLRDQAERNHPLIRPRIEEILRVLRARPPLLVFAGYPPFPKLRELLAENYVPSRLLPAPGGLGLWVDRRHAVAFDRSDPPAARRSPAASPPPEVTGAGAPRHSG
jgi:4-amino-4-deoxy-L-arabinose transferase-like glycosyltransferase